MKKLIALALMMILVLSLAACGGGNDTPNSEDTTTPQPSQDVISDSMPGNDDDGVPDEDTTPPAPVDPNERGNSASNIVNRGIAAIKGDWIYFRDMNNALRKIRTDGTEETTLVEDGCDGGINVVGDWVYYTGRGMIAKVRTDGTEQTDVAFDFGIGSPAECVTVIGEWVYFLKPTPSNPQLCKIKSDGTDETMLLEDGVLDFAVVDDWIYYRNGEQTLCKMKTDGSEQSDVEVVSDDAEFSPGFIYSPVISDDYIYFDSFGLSRMNMDGTGAVKLIEGQLTELAADDGWVYYVQGDPDNLSQYILYKTNADGTEIVEVGSSRENSFYDLNIVGEWVYFSGSTDSGSALFRIRTDGTDEQVIA